ncbi:hypothetical protein Nepgr_002707 [Nepenthes gracilis]|uniref:Uncharacterized protein n=1 Tax=Nepenthes gracilis TaxID=150966 RepID=A0AAD3P7H2_NEPGR|nr:hypothetical protein Nepgr_002707 [Nepenthes gracilis]
MEEGTESRFTVGGEPRTPSAETPREPKVVGVVSVPKTSGLTRPICELAQVREDVITIEAVLTEERVLNLSTEIA